jgi:hypothetical protein
MTTKQANESERQMKEKIQQKQKKKEDEALDSAVEDSFPASDPPARSVPTTPGPPKGHTNNRRDRS